MRLLVWIYQILVWAGWLGSSVVWAETREMPALFLSIGEQKILSISRLKKYSIGGQTIRILPLPPSLSGLHSVQNECLLIKGVAPGLSDLWVWKSDGLSEHRVIHVSKRETDKEETSNNPLSNSKLAFALQNLSEVEVLFSGPQVVLRGEILTLKETAWVASLLSSFPKEIQDETQLSLGLLTLGQEKIDEWIKNSGYSNQLRTEKIGSQLWVRGSLEQPSQLSSVKKQLLAIFPLLAIEIEALPDLSPIIYFRVFLLELKKNQFSHLGIFWGSASPQAFQVTLKGIQDLLKLDLTLQHLEGTGEAKVLSNPELVVRAPGEAELFAGGELPIKMQTKFSSNVLWKKFGLTLKLKVTHVAGNRVRLDILTEVTHLDLSIASEGIPGIQANRMTTQVDARFGTPLLLSGLLQDRIRDEARGLPMLRNIPILGKLFGSEDYLNQRSELVAILYPQAPPPTAPMKKLGRAMPEQRLFQSEKDYPWNQLE